ncbi:hypothetical protein EB72_02220 [Mycobacterium sp. SWH-M1]|nr:hypothetical protein EB72_02220 [Mycobacterium sp. SWH-M1]
MFEEEESDWGQTVEALDVYRPASASHDGSEDLFTTVLFTASNPENTVSAVALMSGLVVRVILSPDVVTMTERELSDEIRAVTTMARLQALAGQHVVIANLMQSLGQDGAATESFLHRELHLPAPELVEQRRAVMFA